MGGISGWQLLILLLIVVLVFGTKRLRNIGSDLGGAIKGFRKGMEDAPEQPENEASPQLDNPPEDATTSPVQDNDPAQRPPGTDV